MAHNLWFFDDVMERAMRRERVFRDRSNLLEIYNEDFISWFRLPKEAILSLTDELAEVLSPATSRSHSIPAVLQVLGLSKASVSRVVYRVSRALSNKLPQFPNQMAELNKLKRGFFSIARFPNVVGAIDGTHVRIQAPTAHEHFFVNRKGYHSLNIQAVCDSDLRFLNSFEQGIIDGVLLGDSGYPLWLLTPFLNPTTPAQRNYNAAHGSTGNTVERELRMAPDRVCNIICLIELLFTTCYNYNQNCLFH
uniref:DDE Tnp4 domain-containing protein n=1 Tax=Cyprinus carpio TaxID=7962 RepID=A0A8C1ZZD5_CYPCA